MFSKRVICYFIHVVVIFVHMLHTDARLTTAQMSHSPQLETVIPYISLLRNVDIILFRNSLTMIFVCYRYIRISAKLITLQISKYTNSVCTDLRNTDQSVLCPRIKEIFFSTIYQISCDGLRTGR